MLVGSKAQLKSLNVVEFISNYEGTPVELEQNTKYLGMSIYSDISCDFHVQRLCQNMYYHLSLVRRLHRIFPKELLLQVYKSYLQPRLNYGITLYGFSTHKNIDMVQRVPNHAASLITGNFDYINCRGIDLVKSLNLYNIRDRRDHFLTILMFKAIHGIAPTYLWSYCHGILCKWLWHQRVWYGFISSYTAYRGLSKRFYVYGWQTMEWSA